MSSTALPDRSVAPASLNPIRAPSLATPPPEPLAPLVGREREVAAVCQLLRRDDIRLVTLSGPGGIGKTRLALRIAEEAAADLADGAVFASLAAVRDPSLVLPAIAETLHIGEAGSQPLPDRLRASLAQRDVLLILDNCEPILAAGPRIAELLAGCPGLTILTTGRAPLGLSGERVFRVPPLSLAGVTPPGEAEAAEAVRLFVERAQAARLDFALTAENTAAVAEICRRLDGLPLAIELAAAQMRYASPSALLARLEQLPLVTGGPRGQSERLRTMRDAIDWSYDLLEEHERALFRRLAVFAGGFTLEAAEAVCDPWRELGIDTLTGIAPLVDQSLIRAEAGADGEPRFGMLETVRELAAEHLMASGEADQLRRWHAEYFLVVADKVAHPLLNVSDWGPVLRQIDVEHDNLQAALAWTAGRDPGGLVRLAAALGPYWYLRGHLNEGRLWLERAVAVGDVVPPLDRVAALRQAGGMARLQGDHRRAAELLNQALALARLHGGPGDVGRVLNMLAEAAEDVGDYDRTAALVDEAVTLLRGLDEPWWAGASLCAAGHVALLRDDVTTAEELLREARTRFRTDGHAYGAALAASELAEVALARGEPLRAAALWRERLTLSWDLWGLRWALPDLAAVAIALGDVDRAARLLGAAEAHRERLGAVPVGRPWQQPEMTERAAKAVLGGMVFQTVWSEGQRLSTEQARAEAMAVVMSATSQGNVDEGKTATPPAGLTVRELDVLRLLVAGRSNPEIADALFIGRGTVRTHVSSILGKLGAKTRTEAADLAHRQNLI